MSVHVCKCEHNGRTEYHVRYPGWTEREAQWVADKINGGALWSASEPDSAAPEVPRAQQAPSESSGQDQDARDAARYRWLREHKPVSLLKLCPSPNEWYYATHEVVDAAIDAAMAQPKPESKA